MKKVLFAAATAFVILIAGCSREPGYEDESALTSLKVTIKNENDWASRAMGNEPTQAQENTVIQFAVYVFHNSTGVLEKSEIFDQGLTGEVTGLTTVYQKRVVVLVNYDFSVLGTIENYSQLEEGVINIDSQIPNFTTDGLFMSGEKSAVQLSSTATNEIDVEVSRVAAKIRLGTLEFSPDDPATLNNFELQGVSVQKVPYWAYMLGDDIPDLDPALDEYRGGRTGSVSTDLDVGFLYQKYGLPASYQSGDVLTPEIYFYVFPNDNSEKKATLLTIHGTYNGADTYYTFPINYEVVPGQTDGTFIQRNKIYTLYITVKKLGAGADDPDAISDLVNLRVNLVVEDWLGTLSQNGEW